MAHTGVVQIELIGEEWGVWEVTDSFTLSAEMDSRLALDNPAIARLIRSVVLRFQKAGAVVTRNDVFEFSPVLADRVAVNWNVGAQEAVRRLRRSIGD